MNGIKHGDLNSNNIKKTNNSKNPYVNNSKSK